MGYQLELRHFNYFQVLAEELHFRRAAERLFISQPGLTRQIKQMEEIYGVSLFERGTRFVRLTAAGVYLKKEVDTLFHNLERVEQELKAIADHDALSLRLGFIGSAVQSILAQLLITLKHEHPRVEVDLQELSNEAQVTKLLKEELDFGFVRIDAIPKGLTGIPVLTEHFSLVVPYAYPTQQDNFTKLLALQEEPFILFSKDYSHSYFDLVMSIFKDAGFQPHVALRTVNALTIFNMVEQGLGVAIVPASLKKGYTTQVKFIDLDQIPQRTTLSLLWNPKVKQRGINVFLDIVQKEIHA
ncbi:LysR family transcriptional regulator [Sphingobacterium psychroaquaticum]|uniref:DNA-binding transcriptional regulator, LysR family n=1 Tax=Sphingobacterium psychroaquaticum TaxID=561061 RepID=A0A1X7KNP5_9SPHI|nr:LysR family transcriptional regulator [Sphingobacterium psychroaquaticum]SMG43158.1 DNA-binding transcriptional regulator, LysR family [Sphingobacterium psychroaquaticum]